jgi:hypothetical protein
VFWIKTSLGFSNTNNKASASNLTSCSQSTSWMHSIYYAPNMGRDDSMSRERLELLRSSAFESEHAWQYDLSYMEHEAAAVALEQEIEQSLASISPDENSDEQIRIIKTQITIHRERQRALRPHLESGSGDFDGWGNECAFVPAPNQWGANGDLDEESETLSSVRWNDSKDVMCTCANC